MDLVVGATGLLGGEISRRLAARGRLARALARPTSSPERVHRLRDLGLEIVEGDLEEAPREFPLSLVLARKHLRQTLGS